MGNTAILAYSILNQGGYEMVNEIAVEEGQTSAMRIPKSWNNMSYFSSPFQDNMGLNHKFAIIGGGARVVGASYEIRINCKYANSRNIFDSRTDEMSRLDDGKVMQVEHRVTDLERMKCMRFCIQTQPDTVEYFFPIRFLPPPVSIATKSTIWKRRLRIDNAYSSTWTWWGDKNWTSIGKGPSEMKSVRRNYTYEWDRVNESKRTSSIGWMVELVAIEPGQVTNAFCSNEYNYIGQLVTSSYQREWDDFYSYY
eukprot:GHVH01010058.1.p1 GENE.GHVH01010058.1~~GHVH01010058.1.p1  ORF type:complete len:271 (-),score=30.71 GHVH01010058.1:55-813(-)